MKIKVLNAYSGIGGNRLHWKNVDVVAVELNPSIAKIYQKLFPRDTVIVEDAHKYIEKNYKEFDVIWASPPCQSHSKMSSIYKTKTYPDFGLYEEIVFLSKWFKGNWVVENVRPYYKPLIPPHQYLGRHAFWSNVNIPLIELPPFPDFGNFKSHSNEIEHLKVMLKWLDLPLKLSALKGNFRTRQIIQNCVHPIIGKHIIQTLQK